MSDASITACFIDHEPDGHNTNLAAEARFGLVSYRRRPPDTMCQHPVVDFGKPEKRDGQILVSCVCLGCGLSWQSCKVVHVASHLVSESKEPA